MKSRNFFQINKRQTLGTGSYATVKLAVDKKTQQKYAIKIYEKFKLSDQQKMKNVRREINILEKLNHKNIIKLFHTIDALTSVQFIGLNSR
jgi:serine/threonine protein kinase